MQCSDLERFLAGGMNVDERAEFAQHLAGCPLCGEAMIFAFENAGNPWLSPLPIQPMPPRGLTERITRELYRQRCREFRVYTLQVVLSTCAAVALIFTGSGKMMNLRNMAADWAENRGYTISAPYQGGSLTDFDTEVLYDANTKK